MSSSTELPINACTVVQNGQPFRKCVLAFLHLFQHELALQYDKKEEMKTRGKKSVFAGAG